MIYLITWDLNSEGAAYSSTSKHLHDRLDKLKTIKHPLLDSVRFVSTEMSARALYDYIDEGNILDSNDKIVVTRMRRGEYWGVVSEKVWEWIEEHL